MSGGERVKAFSDFLCPDCDRSSLYEDCAANLSCSCGYRGNWLSSALNGDEKLDLNKRAEDIKRLQAVHYKFAIIGAVLALICAGYSLLPFLGMVPGSISKSPLQWALLFVTIPVSLLATCHALDSWGLSLKTKKFLDTVG